MDLQQKIQQAVGDITDHDLGARLKDLDALHSVEVQGDSVTIKLLLHQPLHFIAQELDEACKKAVLELHGGADVEVLVQEVEPKHVPNRVLPQVKNLIAVASGKGGVGKSTVTANLAVALARQGATVGLIDADIHGPSVPTMFGLEGEQLRAEKGEDGKIMGYPFEKHGVQLASIGFVMQQDQAAILRGPMQAGYFATLFEQIKWEALDYLLFDLPPGTGDIQLTLTQKIPLTGSVIVTTPQHVALADVRRGISMFRKVNVPILGLVENMSHYVDADGTKQYIFGQDGGKNMAQELDTPFLGEIPLHQTVREGGDSGVPVVANNNYPEQAEVFFGLAKKLARETRRKNFTSSQAQTVQISL